MTHDAPSVQHHTSAASPDAIRLRAAQPRGIRQAPGPTLARGTREMDPIHRRRATYHEGNPWREPQRITRTHLQVVIGCLFSLALLIVLAILEIQAAAIVMSLALATGLILLIGSRTRHCPHAGR
jgi:hypothetical protein